MLEHHFLDDEGTFDAGVEAQRAEGLFDRLTDDLGADLLVADEGVDDGVDGLDGAQESDTTTGDDAFFNGRTGGVQGVVDAVLLLLELGLGRGTHVDDGDAAGQLGEAFLELFLIVVGGGLVDLATDELHAALDVGGLAGTLDDRGVLLVSDDALGATEVSHLDGFELDTEVIGDEAATGEDGDVFHHGLAAVAEARGLDGADVDRTAEAVDDEGSEGFAFDFLSDDQERLAGLGDFLEERQQVLHGADLLLVEEDVGVFEDGLERLGVGREVRGEVTLVELHAFDDVEGGLDGLGFFDGDGAVLTHAVHGFGDDVTDGLVPVGGDGGDLLDFLAVLDLLGNHGEFLDDGFGGLVDATLDEDRVGTGGDEAEAFFVDGFGQDGRGGRAVTRLVSGLRGDFAHHLGAHVFVRIVEFDLLSDGDAVLGDLRGAELLVDHHIAALRTEGDFDGTGEDGDAIEHLAAGGFVEQNLLLGHSGVV